MTRLYSTNELDLGIICTNKNFIQLEDGGLNAFKEYVRRCTYRDKPYEYHFLADGTSLASIAVDDLPKVIDYSHWETTSAPDVAKEAGTLTLGPKFHPDTSASNKLSKIVLYGLGTEETELAPIETPSYIHLLHRDVVRDAIRTNTSFLMEMQGLANDKAYWQSTIPQYQWNVSGSSPAVNKMFVHIIVARNQLKLDQSDFRVSFVNNDGVHTDMITNKNVIIMKLDIMQIFFQTADNLYPPPLKYYYDGSGTDERIQYDASTETWQVVPRTNS